MRLEIYDDTDPEPESVVRLRLVTSLLTKSVAVVAVDAAGSVVDGGHILRITEDGEIRRYPSVGSDLGFRRDDCGRVKSD